MDAPTINGNMKDESGTDRSNHKKLLSTGTAVWTIGSQLYSSLDRSARFSGLEGNTLINAQYNPIQMGIWMIMGPRQPMGFMPFSLYIRNVSDEIFCLSFLYRACIAFNCGCTVDIARVDLICFNVSRMVARRMSIVSPMMLSPKFLNNNR